MSRKRTVDMSSPAAPALSGAPEPPKMHLTPKQVQELAEHLQAYHARFVPLYERSEQRHWGAQYLHGLLLNLPNKTIAPIARAVPQGSAERTRTLSAKARALQQFISEGSWKDELLLAEHRRTVAETLGDPEGALIIDGSDFPKQGKESVGVARQYCGETGKIDNCQSGVFLSYASRHGYTLLDRRLYLPQVWFGPEYAARWQRYGVPPDRRFLTHPQLAWEMIEGVLAGGELGVRWVLCDEGFGRDRALLERVSDAGLWYLAEVPVSEQVWLKRPHTHVPKTKGRGRPPTRRRLGQGEPKPIALGQLAKELPASAWRLHKIKEGSKGPEVAEFAFVRAVAVRDRMPGPAVWAVFRRSVGPKPKLKVYLSNAPARTARRTLVGLSGMRWPIERCFEEAKGYLGMNQYEVRTWRGWHHHMSMVILAHHFLVSLRLRLKGGRLRLP